MNLDDRKGDLHALETKASTRVRIDPTTLRTRRFFETGRAMQRLRAWLWIESSVNVVAVVMLGSLLASHASEPRFFATALPLLAVAIAHVVFGVHQLVALGRVDFAGSLVAIQRRLETLRAWRVRMTKWTVLLAPLLWIPLLVVACEALFGVDVCATFDRAWLVVNVAFGVAFVPAMLWLSKSLGDRFAASPLLRRIVRDVGRRNLAAAQAFLDDLARLHSRDGTNADENRA